MNRFLSLVILLHISCSTFCQIEDYRFWITKTYGGNGYGKISSVNTDGSGYHHGIIYSGALEGSNPKPGFLNGSDGKVYGTTSEGGSFDRGVIFSMNPDGSTYTVLHHFTSVMASPSGQLIEGPNGKLYGICALSDPYISIVFRLDRNTGIFEVIHEFRVNDDGTVPTSLMFASNGMLYGTCQQKGISNNIGTIFRINPTTHTFVKLTDTHGPSPGPLIEGSDGFLYGIAPKGGTMSSGEIHRINLDGSGYTSLFDLNSVGGTSANSYIMEGPDGFLYGTCRVGTGGLVFKIRKSASDFTTLHTFEESTNWAPTSGLLIASDGLLYGYASHVYSSQKYLYRINLNGAGFEQLNDAPYTLDQTVPVEVEGSFLFASVSDGEARNGRIMKVIPGGTSLTIKEFAEIENQPYKILHSRSDEIYGINKNGGAEGYGGVFKLTKDGTHLLTTIFKNSATNHELLTYHLAEDGDGNFYAYTLGADNVSAISKLSPNGSRSTIYDFSDNSNISYNTGEPILGSDGRVYGMTLRGGIHGKGTIFSLRTDGSEFTTGHSFTENTIPRQPFQFESGGYLIRYRKWRRQ
jgi:uncharacterized repeat protein (TIGR03803 family)